MLRFMLLAQTTAYCRRCMVRHGALSQEVREAGRARQCADTTHRHRQEQRLLDPTQPNPTNDRSNVSSTIQSCFSLYKLNSLARSIHRPFDRSTENNVKVYATRSVCAMHRLTMPSSCAFSSAAATRSLSFSCLFTTHDACVSNQHLGDGAVLAPRRTCILRVVRTRRH